MLNGHACPPQPGATGWVTLSSLGKMSTQTMQAEGTRGSLEYPQSHQGLRGQDYLLEDTQPFAQSFAIDGLICDSCCPVCNVGAVCALVSLIEIYIS